MNPLRTLIVDDEPLARERLCGMLTGRADVELLGEARNGREAVEACARLRPELLLLDVQMPELDGFGVLQHLAAPLPSIVFVTAFDQYALRAFEVHALDYLLKPFDRARLNAAIERARKAVERERLGELDPRLYALLDELEAKKRWVERLHVKTVGRVDFVEVRDIDWIEACGNYVKLHVGAGEHLLRETLTKVESRLDPAEFVRIHRSTIVRLARVKVLEPQFHGDAQILLQDGTRLPLSRNFREKAEAALRRG